MLATLLISTTFLAAAPAQAVKSTPVAPLTLTGCVSTKPDSGGNYTFTTDNKDAPTYRLTGKNIRDYAGKKVEVVESTTKKVAVRGGLYPAPNIAGQAGALDPVQSAIATQPGAAATTGRGDPPEFRASRVRAMSGACQ